MEEGDWWYRVVHPNGAHFAKIPSLQPKAPRHLTAVPQNTVVHACRRYDRVAPGILARFYRLLAIGRRRRRVPREHATSPLK